ncbi:MAG: hypothetical protein RL095_3781 [Verrucomicrobiota bacterium]|jgi:enamine deaminase RidA (YjgF/YER057c/UK114 family)
MTDATTAATLQSLSLERSTLSAPGLFQAALAQLPPGGRILRCTAFGLPAAQEPSCRALLRQAGQDDRIAWLLDPAGPGGLQLQYLEGFAPQPLTVDGVVLGHLYEDDAARYCCLNALHDEPDLAPAGQTRRLYARLERALQVAGMDFTDIRRTWFYLDDILAWYGDFNAVRSEVFRRLGVFGRCIPASTGIGAANSRGSALMLDVLAIRPKISAFSCAEAPSPLQGSALDYGSSFSRAMAIRNGDCRQLLISGTASIDLQGSTVFPTDCQAQIERTLEVVAAMLAAQDLDWRDVNRAISYFRHAAHIPLYDKVCRRLGLPELPLVSTALTVCRPDLLFEIELDAVKARR